MLCYNINGETIKRDIPPFYRTVMFHDTSADKYFKVGSTIKTDREIELESQTWPYVTLDVSSASHPHYIGRQRAFEKESGPARFQQRYGRFLARRYRV